MDNQNIIIKKPSYYNPLPPIQSSEHLLKKLCRAIQRDDAELIRFWTKRGASVSAKDADGNTPLHLAVTLGFLNSTEALLEAGAHPQDRNNEGKSAIQIALQNNSHALVLKLDQSLHKTPQAYVSDADLNKEGFSLLSNIINIADEEDPISTEILAIKAVLRPRRRKEDLDALLKQLKQPWELCACESKDWQKNAVILANPQGACYAPIRKLSQDIQQMINALKNNQKNANICASLGQIRTVYQNFIQDCSQAQSKERERLLQGRVCLRGVAIGCRYLDPEAAMKILAPKKENAQGSHIVNYFHNIYWKHNPDGPGVEKAVLELAKLICHQGSPPTILLNFKIDKNKTLPILASYTIEGESLNKVMLEHPEWLEKLDPAHFSMMVFLGLLIDPYDGKPDNFITPIVKDMSGCVERVLISSIDNDLSFSDVFVRSDRLKQVILDVLYVLFIFPQMHEPVNQAFRDQFLRLSPEETVIEWLKSMIKQNKSYENLLRQKIFTKDEFHELQLPFTMRPHSANEEGCIEGLYRKLCILQRALHDNPQVTHQELFRLVHPLVASVYEKLVPECTQNGPERNWGAILGYWDRIRSAINIEKAGLLSSDPEASSLHQDRFSPYQRLQKGGCKSDSRTLSPEKALERFLPMIPWNDFSMERQVKLLHAIITVSELRELFFSGAEVLNDEVLIRTLTGFPNLETLTLIGCPHVSGSGLCSLLYENPCLKLILERCSGLQADDYDLLTKLNQRNLLIRFPSGECYSVKERSIQLLHEALENKDEEIFFFALRLGIRPDANALLIVATLDHQDNEQLKRWMTALFLCMAKPNDAVWNALEANQLLLNHMNRLKRNHLAVYMEARKKAELWLNLLPADWPSYWPKYIPKN